LIDLEAVMAVLVIFSTVSIMNLIVRLVTSNNNAVNISWNLGFKHIVVQILFCNEATHFSDIGIIL
jgi:hypothetical protein